MQSKSIDISTFDTLASAAFKVNLKSGGNWENYFMLKSFVGWKVFALTFPWINSEIQWIWPKKNDTILLYDEQIAEALFYKATSIEATNPMELFEKILKIITDSPESIKINENIGTE